MKQMASFNEKIEGVIAARISEEKGANHQSNDPQGSPE